MKTLWLLILIVVTFNTRTGAQDVVQDAVKAVGFYQAGMEALEKEDIASYADNMRAALAAAPGQPVVIRHLARALALQGNGDEAVALLARVAAMGVDLGVADDENFASLRDRDDFKAVLATIAGGRTALGNPELAFRLDADDMLPEGIAYDPVDDVFYIGSIRHGNIIRVSRTGRWDVFSAPGDMLGVLGLRVDVERRRLWALSAVMPGVEGFTEERSGESAVHCFDLDGEVVVARYHQPNADGEHNFNDVVVGHDGAVYITDSVQGAIYTIHPDHDKIEALIPSGELRGPNGIAISPDGTLLYVAQYAWGIAVVDIAARSWRPMPHPDDVAPIGIDGLYLHRGALVAVQNYVGLAHVTRFELSGDGRSIVGSSILARHDPHFEDPTTGAICGDDIYVVANSQLPKVDADGALPPADTFDDTFILKIRVE